VTGEIPLEGDAALARAGRTGRPRFIWPRPWHPDRSVRCEEKPSMPHAAGAATVEQVFGLVPALAPMPEQASQVTETGNLDCAALAAEGVSSVIPCCSAGRATMRTPRPRRLSGHANRSSKISEKGRGGKKKSVAETGHRRQGRLSKAMAEAVIGPRACSLSEDLVGLVEFLELDFAWSIPGCGGGNFIASVADGDFSTESSRAFDLEGFVIDAWWKSEAPGLSIAISIGRNNTSAARDHISRLPLIGSGQPRRLPHKRLRN